MENSCVCLNHLFAFEKMFTVNTKPSKNYVTSTFQKFYKQNYNHPNIRNKFTKKNIIKCTEWCSDVFVYYISFWPRSRLQYRLKHITHQRALPSSSTPINNYLLRRMTSVSYRLDLRQAWYFILREIRHCSAPLWQWMPKAGKV
jgi:hypothetical protein